MLLLAGSISGCGSLGYLAHQGLGQETPEPLAKVASADPKRVVAHPVLGGLHHDYRVAA